MADFARTLEKYTQIRYRRMHKSKDPLPDTPTEPFPDPQLRDGMHLTRRGRSGAYLYDDAQAFSRHAADDGTQYFAMRRTLASWVDGEWSQPPTADIQPPPAAWARHMARVVSAALSSAFPGCPRPDLRSACGA